MATHKQKPYSQWTPAQKARRMQQRKQAQAEQTPSPTPIEGGFMGDIPPVVVEETLVQHALTPELEVQVNISEEEKPKLSLKDRLFGARSPGAPVAPTPIKKAPTGRGRKAAAQDNLITSVLPTVIASFIATYSRHLLPEPYKRCAPSMEECNGVLGPLLSMIGRRVEIVGKASQDVLDITNSIICAFAYSTRAYITYIDIKREGDDGGRTDQKPDSRTSGHSTSGNGNGQSTNGSEHGIPNNQDGDREDGRDEIALVNDLFARDKRGRIGLGLLSG